MIDAKQLSPDNFVLRDDGLAIRVTIQDMYLINTGGRADLISYVPLTEEWLERLGFERLPHFTVGNTMLKNIGRNRVISVSCVGTPNLMVTLQEVNGKQVTDLVVVHNYDYDGPMHVHQLQNLYHALTGQELTLHEAQTAP